MPPKKSLKNINVFFSFCSCWPCLRIWRTRWQMNLSCAIFCTINSGLLWNFWSKKNSCIHPIFPGFFKQRRILSAFFSSSNWASWRTTTPGSGRRTGPSLNSSQSSPLAAGPPPPPQSQPRCTTDQDNWFASGNKNKSRKEGKRFQWCQYHVVIGLNYREKNIVCFSCWQSVV